MGWQFVAPFVYGENVFPDFLVGDFTFSYVKKGVFWRGIVITDEYLDNWHLDGWYITDDRCGQYITRYSGFVTCWELVLKLFDRYRRPLRIYVLNNNKSYFEYVIDSVSLSIWISDGALMIHRGLNCFKYDLSDSEFYQSVFNDCGLNVSLC